MRMFELALPSDDLNLRTLLRTNQMPSWAVMSMEREPSYFNGMNHYGRDWAVISRDAADVIGMYACSTHAVHCNGTASEVGYLGSLRVNPCYRNQLRILKEGYASIPRLSPVQVPFWYTAIAAGNMPAKRILEANLPEMPCYRYINDLVTLALPKSRGCRLGLWREMRFDDVSAACVLYNCEAKRYHFAPALTPELIEKTGAPFYVAEHNGVLLATMALWNQQSYKQVVARGYRQPLTAMLPTWNLFARMTRRVQLPKVGGSLNQAYIAFLAVSDTMKGDIGDLIRDALALCSTEVLTLGLHERHPWLTELNRKFKPFDYRAHIYTVSFGENPSMDTRPAQPEVAIL